MIAITAFLCHVLLTGAAASGQDDSALTVNPSAETLAQEEMHRMDEEAAEAFYQNAELAEELESEIQFLHQEIPVENYPAEEWGLKREIRSSRASERLITAPLYRQAGEKIRNLLSGSE